MIPAAPKKISGRAAQFIDSVLRLRPRLALFDCDGTLWDGDAGADFFYWEIEQGLIPKEVVRWALPRYDDYKAGKVGEEAMCGEMVTIHAGVREEEIFAAARRFFETVVAPRIFPEMQQLTHRLAANGCRLWAVSSTNEWVIRAGASHFGFPAEHVLAASVAVDNGHATGRLLRVPTDEGKAAVVRELIADPVDTAFGNSIHDAAMLELARHGFAVNPNPDFAPLAERRGWTVYHPDPL